LRQVSRAAFQNYSGCVTVALSSSEFGAGPGSLSEQDMVELGGRPGIAEELR
jgi:hypothetical protein